MADNKDTISCPACGKEMKKVYMPEQDVNLDVCLDGCGGIFFDNREYGFFINTNDDISPIIQAYQNKKFIKVNDFDLRICPVCGQKMVKNYSSSTRNIQIDECYACGGKFLDFLELEKIRQEIKQNVYKKAPELLPEKYLYSLAQIGLIDPDEIETFNTIKNTNYETFSDDNASSYIIEPDSTENKKNFVYGAFLGAIVGVLFTNKIDDIYVLFYPVFREFDSGLVPAQIDLILNVFVCVLFACLFGFINMKRKQHKNN